MNAEADKWSHLDPYERKYYKKRIQAYDEIMETTTDISIIASRYQLTVEEVQRAKNYAFGQGVYQYKLTPDPDMAEAWKRIARGQGTKIDEVLLRHEIFESDLVINQKMNPKDAHDFFAQKKYPWSELLKKN